MKYILLIHLRIRVERLRMLPIDFYILYIDAYKTHLCEPRVLVVSISPIHSDELERPKVSA